MSLSHIKYLWLVILNWIGIFYFSDIVYQLIEEQVRCYNQVFLVGPGSNTNDWFLFDKNFYRKLFPSKMAIEIWILIPIIPRNMFKLHSKEIHTKYGKICVCEKKPHENYPCEKKSWVKWSEISLLFKESMPWLVLVCMGSSSSLYHQNVKLIK